MKYSYAKCHNTIAVIQSYINLKHPEELQKYVTLFHATGIKKTNLNLSNTGFAKRHKNETNMLIQKTLCDRPRLTDLCIDGRLYLY